MQDIHTIILCGQSDAKFHYEYNDADWQKFIKTQSKDMFTVTETLLLYSLLRGCPLSLPSPLIILYFVFLQVEAPLLKAKQIAMLSVEHYNTVFSVTKYVSFM